MIKIQILEGTDKIKADDYCRPLEIMQEGWSDEIQFTSTYSGLPCNNLKWVKVSDVLGECWHGKPVDAFNHKLKRFPKEFVRGAIPKEHILVVDNPLN